MVATLQQKKQKKLVMLPDGDRVRFEGGIPVLSGEAAMELYDPFLDEIGRVTFARKLEEEDFTAEDMSHVTQFLVKRGIRPTTENAFTLVMGARLHMFLVEGFDREQR